MGGQYHDVYRVGEGDSFCSRLCPFSSIEVTDFNKDDEVSHSDFYVSDQYLLCGLKHLTLGFDDGKRVRITTYRYKRENLSSI